MFDLSYAETVRGLLDTIALGNSRHEYNARFDSETDTIEIIGRKD